MIRNVVFRRMMVSCFVVLVAGCATPQAADIHGRWRPATDEEPTTLATMTVTAQKREEAMQDVPIAITAVSEQLLQDTGVRDIKDLQVLVPATVTTAPHSRTTMPGVARNSA